MYPKAISRLSTYANSLPTDSRNRYVQKIRPIGYVDPYDVQMNVEQFPTTVTSGHIVDYLVNHVSPVSGVKFRKDKSLQAYRKFEAGFVSMVQGTVINKLHVIRGKVSHSMKLNLPPLSAWIIIERNGRVQSAHCNCVAGLCEACSHVSALLFALANLHTMVSTYKLSVTELPCYWARPSKKIIDDLCHPVNSIDYGFKVTRMDDLNVNCSQAEFQKIVGDLKDAAVLRKFCDGNTTICVSCEEIVVPDFIFQQKNVLLQNLFNPALEGKPLEDIRKEVQQILLTLTISYDDISLVELLTRKQSASELWKWARIGRITASIMKECMHTSTETLPTKMTLLRKICHPDSVQFVSEATSYGRNHENEAKRALMKKMKSHDGATFSECGIFIDRVQPYLAATPDLMMTCKCHGKVCIEIKCPYRLRGKTTFNQQLPISSLIGTSNPFLEYENGVYVLAKQHSYYAQIQTQIYITDSNCGMLFVWSKKDQLSILVEKDPAFWEEAREKSYKYFEGIVLVEILSNYYSNQLKH